MFGVDHSTLDIDKEISFLTERLDSFILKCKAYAGVVEDIHMLSDRIIVEVVYQRESKRT
jgi:hypothetical protein